MSFKEEIKNIDFNKIIKVAIIGALFRIQEQYNLYYGFNLSRFLIGSIAIYLSLRWVK